MERLPDVWLITFPGLESIFQQQQKNIFNEWREFCEFKFISLAGGG